MAQEYLNEESYQLNPRHRGVPSAQLSAIGMMPRPAPDNALAGKFFQRLVDIFRLH